MTHTDINKIAFSILVATFVLTALLIAGWNRLDPAFGAAESGLSARVATTSQLAVGAASTIFATTTGGNCAARIITTLASPIMLTFSDFNGPTPSFSLGVIQAPSTTVAYDSQVYGCDAVKAFSFVSQTIGVIETR